MKYFKYKPSDIVYVKENNFKGYGFITKAQILTFNGERYDYFDRERPKSKNNLLIEYAIEPIKKKDWGKFKYAWWNEEEILKLVYRFNSRLYDKKQ